MTIKQIKEKLTKLGVSFKAKARKQDLLDLLNKYQEKPTAKKGKSFKGEY